MSDIQDKKRHSDPSSIDSESEDYRVGDVIDGFAIVAFSSDWLGEGAQNRSSKFNERKDDTRTNKSESVCSSVRK